jgi:hypothetical protein
MNLNDLKSGDVITILKFVGVCACAAVGLLCLVLAFYTALFRSEKNTLSHVARWVRFAFCVLIAVGCIIGIVFLVT